MNYLESLDKAFVVQIDFPRKINPSISNNSFNEFKELCSASGAKIEGHYLGKQNEVSSNLYITKGKAENIRKEVLSNKVDLVIFNHDLSPSQERNLENLFQARVLDRTGLILDIFASRATSHVGKLQVELAQLTHLSTRLVRGWSHLERQKGGIGLRGPGETQLETDRRLIGQRIRSIKKRLEKTHKQKEVNRYSRNKGTKKLVALVGYTNAGKTSLFNVLTKNKLFSADMPFATLDSVTRRSSDQNLPGLLFSDTVGFISDLPTKLIESFKSTLDELRQANLLLHVIDVSDPDVKFKCREVEKLLHDLGLSDIEVIEVFNKSDLLDAHPKEISEGNKVWISAKNKQGLEQLSEKIKNSFADMTIRGWISLGDEDSEIMKILYRKGMVIEEGIDESGLVQLHVEIQKDRPFDFLSNKKIRTTNKQEAFIEELI